MTLTILRSAIVAALCVGCCFTSKPIIAQAPATPSGNGWVADASHTFLNAHKARGRFQNRSFIVQQALFEKMEVFDPDAKSDKAAHKLGDAYVISLAGGTGLTNDDLVSLVFGTEAPSDRFEIALFAQPGKSISHRTVTMSSTGVTSGISYPGGKAFLFRGASLQVAMVPHGKDVTDALYLNEDRSNQYTLRLRIETVDSKRLLGAVYLCINDEEKSFVEGRFEAHALDALPQWPAIGHTRALGEAIKSSNVAKLRALLQESGDPNAKLYTSTPGSGYNMLFTKLFAHESGELGYDTLMIAAAIRGEYDCVAALLEAGANINLPNSAKMTPLMLAPSGDLKLANLLLEHGADPKRAGPRGLTALRFAVAKAGNLPLCKRLVAAGADINAVDERGHTPLMEAVRFAHGSLDIARWLIDSHADVNTKDRQGHTAFYYAETDAMRILLHQAGATQ